MTAAIYARKSTDQHVTDEQKSVARQIEHAHAYGKRHGWTIDPAHVFVDDGISGAEFSARPGFVRLMNALKPRAPFAALIMSESSRLGREQFETGFALKQLSQAGVRCYSYLDGREIALDSAIDKFMMSASTFAAELEREKSRQRVADTMARKARAGQVCGGRGFGYDNVCSVCQRAIPPGTVRCCREGYTERRINDGQAAIVSRIFKMSDKGTGFTRIAKALNAEGALCPRPVRGGPAGWSPSSVREILLRPLYRGEVVYNMTRKKDDWGQYKTTDRPEQEWIRTQVPALRIVSDELWYAAQARLTRIRTQMATSGRRGRRDADSPYLLSGFARCATCGGALCVMNRTVYGCLGNHKRGARVCTNALRKPMTGIDANVLIAIEEHLRPRAVLRGLLDTVRERLSPRARASTIENARAALSTVERELANLTRAVALGGDLESLVSELKALEARRRELTAAIAAGDTTARFDRTSIEQTVREGLDEWRALLALAQQRHVAKGRELFRRILVSPLKFTPDDRGVYHFEGDLGVGRLLSGKDGSALATFVVRPGARNEGCTTRFHGIAA